VHQTLTANVLTTGEPSASSTRVLHRSNLTQLFRAQPERALATLHGELLEQPGSEVGFALAELSFLHAENTGKRSYYLAAAVYSYLFLRQWGENQIALALDPRFRLAADLYNRGITSGLMDENGEHVLLEPGTYALPFGELELEVDGDQFLWGGFRLTDFVPVAELEVTGLSTRNREEGLGAPLAASLAEADLDGATPARDYIPDSTKVPATALVFLEDPAAGVQVGRLRGDLRLFTLDEERSLPLGDERLPLEYEPSAALAYSLADSQFWLFERRAFFSGDPIGARAPGLKLIHPYHPGRIPLVLVHGTASSPGRWANMVNELQADPFVLENFQIWLFQYNTGNPIAFSAGLLREALEDAVENLDPDGLDPALRRMVVVGHSQGGLLTKLAVVDSGTTFWDGLSDKPFDEVDLSPQTRELLERSLFFTPLPFVERVVFIATPHRGSYQAKRRLARWVSGMVSLPREIVDMGVELMGNEDVSLRRSLDETPRAIEGMTPDSPFLLALIGMPIDGRVTAHSIIAVLGDGPYQSGTDGIVAFQSAHLEGVASEYVVRSGHSNQSHPLTIREVRRILHEHAEASGPVRETAEPEAPATGAR
jgi:pimeloyl-ACP methyl ester carboxylesterase